MFLLRSVTLCCLIYMHLFSLDWMGWDANTSLSQFEAPSRYGFRVPGSCFSLLVVTFKKESISEYPLSSFVVFYKRYTKISKHNFLRIFYVFYYHDIGIIYSSLFEKISDKNANIQPLKVNAWRRIDGTASLLNAYVTLERHLEEYNYMRL